MIDERTNHENSTIGHRPLYGVFCAKLALLTAIVCLVISAKTYYWMSHDRYQETISGSEIYWAIHKSSQRWQVKRVLLGDSVAEQLYANTRFNDEPFSLACNQSISCVGYYLLLKKFIETNADQLPERIILLIHPDSFRNNLDQIYTFHYFLKPFNSDKYREEFSPLVNAQIRKIPFYYISQFPPVKISDWSPDFEPLHQGHQGALSPISVEYLSKIKALCDLHKMKFCMLPVPVSAVRRAKIERNRAEYMRLASSIGLEREFASFLNHLIVLNDASFIDGRHLVNPDEVRDRYVDPQLREL